MQPADGKLLMQYGKKRRLIVQAPEFRFWQPPRRESLLHTWSWFMSNGRNGLCSRELTLYSDEVASRLEPGKAILWL